ncbi:ATP-dependent DNA helicase [Mycena latifolia]|nr:ATP-dependent DNA helicase [Mycena latifolia]
MPEDTTSARSWPPVRIHNKTTSTIIPTTPVPHPASRSIPANDTPFRTPFTDKSNQKQFRNGYEITPKEPSFTPYQLQKTGHKRQRAFAIIDRDTLGHLDELSRTEWDVLARRVKLIPADGHLRPLQIECSNLVVSGGGDVCAVGPTGCGKSLLWVLPLHAMNGGISLVITPYTSLGCEGESNNHGEGVSSIFLYSEQNHTRDFELAANGDKMVIYACIEMIEGPSFARLLHSEAWRRRVSGLYMDEAHLVHESHGWRPAYSRAYRLRSFFDDETPLVTISATCPFAYQRSLVTYAGLKSNYTLLNYGNYRPELSTVILPLHYPQNSFKDLNFLVPAGARVADLAKTIIYADDLELLTKMFWWLLARLAAAGLPAHLVDIIHAGLSAEHQRICLEDFRHGRTQFLLGSEKIGAGMNFSDVCRIIQFLCSGVTLAKVGQRKGRGGRGKDKTAVMYLMPEKKMTAEGDLTVDDAGNEDPALIELIQSEQCCEFIFDRWLENPPRDTADTCGQCYRCLPSLLPGVEYEWIAVDPAPSTAPDRANVRTTEEETEEIYQMLVQWRLQHWKSHWRDDWPSYGPTSLIPNSDLDTVAKHAGSIDSVDDFFPLVHGVVHWAELTPPLLEAVKSIFSDVHGPVAMPSPPLPPTEAVERAPDIWDLILAPPARKRRKMTATQLKLGPGEGIIDFSL